MTRRHRITLTGALLLGLLSAIFVPGPPASGGEPAPRVDEVEIAPGEWTPAGGSRPTEASPRGWRTTVEPDMPVDMVGVVSPTGSDPPKSVRVRASEDGRRWTEWVSVGFATDHGPDPGSREAARTRPGTDPIFVGESEFVQLEVDGRPARLALVGVDSNGSTAPITERALAWLKGMFRPAPGHGAPRILTRAEWGADESLRQCEPSYGSVQMAFVHHTENANNYSQAEAPAVLRGIYAYHVTGRGWCDIGYNILIDRFGTVYEGRYGGLDRAVVGAQTGGFNSGSTGIAIIGGFMSDPVPQAALQALQEVIGWKLGVHGVSPVGYVTLVSAGNDKYPAGVPVTFRTVSGHRDGKYTSCPGDQLYALLPAVAQGSLAFWTVDGLIPYDASFLGGAYTAVAAHAGGESYVVTGAGQGGGPHVRVLNRDGESAADFYAYSPSFPGGVRVAAGDVDGDGNDEIITGAGPAGGPHVRVLSITGGVSEVAGFFAFDPSFTGGVFVSSGDVDGDGFDDVIVGADAGGGSHVRAFSVHGGLRELAGFFAYGPVFRGGVRLGSGDVDGDGFDEIMTAPGPGGGPHVRVMTLAGGLREVTGFLAYAGSVTNGLFVGAGDVDGNGTEEIVTAPDRGGGPHVRILGVAGSSVVVRGEWMALHPSVVNGIRVAAGDIAAGGGDEIALALGPGTPARVLLRTADNVLVE